MSYIKNTLEVKEKIVYRAAVSKIACVNALFVFLLSMYPGELTRLVTTELGLTDRRVLGKAGMFMRRTIALPHAMVASVRVQQNMLGRLFGYGRVTIVGKNGDKALFKGIKRPTLLKEHIYAATEMAVLGRTLSQYVEVEEREEEKGGW